MLGFTRWDDTLAVLSRGYGWLPDRRREAGRPTFTTHVAGHRVVALIGPDATAFFYGEDGIRRHGGVPPPVKAILFGRRTVQTLDGEVHRARKAMHLSLATGDRVGPLVDAAAAAWDEAVDAWRARDRIVLFDEAARVLTRAACGWAGVPIREDDVPRAAQDLVLLADGFSSPWRYGRALRARARRERWLADLVRDVRDRRTGAAAGTAAAAIAGYRDPSGERLDDRLAGAELLNVVRPTVVACWWVTFAGHALIRWPQHRARLAGDAAFAEAFAQEVRRFYPFTPFIGAKAVRDLEWDGEPIPAGSLVVLDVYGQDHDPRLWDDPYAFRPERFLGFDPGPFVLIPQGGGDRATGHGCPGDEATVALLRTLLPRLARLDGRAPEQDLTIPLSRVPTRPRSGVLLQVTGPQGR